MYANERAAMRVKDAMRGRARGETMAKEHMQGSVWQRAGEGDGMGEEKAANQEAENHG